MFKEFITLYNSLVDNIKLFVSNIWNLNKKKVFFFKNTEFNLNSYRKFLIKKSFFEEFINKEFPLIDFIFNLLTSINFNRNYNNNIVRSNFRLKNTKKGFYFNFFINKGYNKKQIFVSMFYGLKYLWIGIRYWILPLIVIFIVIYSSLVLKLLPFNKIMFGWICVIMLLYWLLSGFVFFFKKYQFGKYTSVIQRFWKRSYILFWLIEGGTFSVFLFLTINASQESFYMFDQISVYKTHLYSWKFFLLKIYPIVLLIIFTYLLLISLKWNIYSKYSIILLFLTILLTYLVWLEFYQFYHVINFYSQFNWIYDVDDHVWSLELEPRKTRTVNHYIMLLFILKFWHVVFIYGFWIFFVLRCWETKKITYPLLAANFQNFIILYIFAWVFMYPWFKFFFRKFLDNPYYWFYINNRKLFTRVFFNDIKLFLYEFIFFLKKNIIFKKFNNFDFFYWSITNKTVNYESFRKSIIRDRILKSLIK